MCNEWVAKESLGNCLNGLQQIKKERKNKIEMDSNDSALSENYKPDLGYRNESYL